MFHLRIKLILKKYWQFVKLTINLNTSQTEKDKNILMNNYQINFSNLNLPRKILETMVNLQWQETHSARCVCFSKDIQKGKQTVSKRLYTEENKIPQFVGRT